MVPRLKDVQTQSDGASEVGTAPAATTCSAAAADLAYTATRNLLQELTDQ